jgi:hypothetical protein
MNRQYVLFALALVMLFAGMCPAGIIVSVDRSRGQPATGTANKAPIGVFDQNTDPLLGILADGQGVFSDRTYPWVNTPASLANSELVLTFNDDKSTSEIMVTYAVTISQAAVLAITTDDRIPAEVPEFASQQEAVDWATSRIGPPGTFVDTGLTVNLAGDSDRPMSVYATTVAMPAGTYVFGSQPAGKNFYSIIAVPEPATLVLLGLGGLLLRKRR